MTDPRDDAIATMRAARAAPGAAGAVPVAAATVVLIRPGPDGPEILLTRRPSTMAFAANVHVFPGGRVDPSDADPANPFAVGLSPEAAVARLAGTLDPISALAHHVAAVRETLEETGIRIDIGDLVSMTRWVTPESMPRRFDVRFFAAIVPAGTDIVTPSAEVAASRWITAEAALREAAAGTLAMLLPTLASFEQLRGRLDRMAIEATFRPGTVVGPPVVGPPVVGAFEDGLATIDQRWAGGIAGRTAPGWLVGHRDVVLVDPADPTGETMGVIDAALAGRGARLVGVALTGIAPEQAAGVELYAAGRGLPVASGPDGWTPYPRIAVAPGAAVPFGDVRLVADVLLVADAPDRTHRPDGTHGPVRPRAGSLDYCLPDGRRLPPRLAGRGLEAREA